MQGREDQPFFIATVYPQEYSFAVSLQHKKPIPSKKKQEDEIKFQIDFYEIFNVYTNGKQIEPKKLSTVLMRLSILKAMAQKLSGQESLSLEIEKITSETNPLIEKKKRQLSLIKKKQLELDALKTENSRRKYNSPTDPHGKLFHLFNELIFNLFSKLSSKISLVREKRIEKNIASLQSKQRLCIQDVKEKCLARENYKQKLINGVSSFISFLSDNLYLDEATIQMYTNKVKSLGSINNLYNRYLTLVPKFDYRNALEILFMNPQDISKRTRYSRFDNAYVIDNDNTNFVKSFVSCRSAEELVTPISVKTCRGYSRDETEENTYNNWRDFFVFTNDRKEKKKIDIEAKSDNFKNEASITINNTVFVTYTRSLANCKKIESAIKKVAALQILIERQNFDTSSLETKMNRITDNIAVCWSKGYFLGRVKNYLLTHRSNKEGFIAFLESEKSTFINGCKTQKNIKRDIRDWLTDLINSINNDPEASLASVEKYEKYISDNKANMLDYRRTILELENEISIIDFKKDLQCSFDEEITYLIEKSNGTITSNRYKEIKGELKKCDNRELCRDYLSSEQDDNLLNELHIYVNQKAKFPALEVSDADVLKCQAVEQQTAHGFTNN